MQLPSADIFIGLLFLVGTGYGFILRRDKAITTLCSVYIGLVIASSFSETVYAFFNGNATIANQVWIKSNASISSISIAIFLLCIFFISGAINSSNNRSGDISPFEVIIYNALTVALVIASIVNFLPPASKDHYIEASRIIKNLIFYRSLIVVAAPLLLIFLNIRRK